MFMPPPRMHSTSLAERLAGRALVLHSDNGSAMKGSTMLATLEQLGVAPSFSRPRVSNDNAYAESLFRTARTVQTTQASRLGAWTK